MKILDRVIVIENWKAAQAFVDYQIAYNDLRYHSIWMTASLLSVSSGGVIQVSAISAEDGMRRAEMPFRVGRETVCQALQPDENGGYLILGCGYEDEEYPDYGVGAFEYAQSKSEIIVDNNTWTDGLSCGEIRVLWEWAHSMHEPKMTREQVIMNIETLEIRARALLDDLALVKDNVSKVNFHE